MGIRRMFHGDVVESDGFLELPLAAQALYFHLGMEADEDGMVNCARQITRRLGLTEDVLQVLETHGLVILIQDILVIRHFRLANTLKNDRLKPPRYPEISKKIFLCPDKTYSTVRKKGAVTLYTFKRRMMREVGIRKESLNRTERNKTKKNITEPNRTECLYQDARLGGRHTRKEEEELKRMGGLLGQGVLLLSDKQMEDLMDQMGLDGFDHYAKRLTDFILANGATVNNHYATMLKWWKEDTQWKKE